MFLLLPSLSGPMLAWSTRALSMNSTTVPFSYLSDAEYQLPVDRIVVDQSRFELLCLMPTVPWKAALYGARSPDRPLALAFRAQRECKVLGAIGAGARRRL